MSPGDWINLLATIIAATTAVVAIVGWRRSQLRHSEVLDWSNEAIAALRTLYLMLSDSTDCERIDVLTLKCRISVLCNQGRLLFQNIKPRKGLLAGWGKEKPAAYQGIRPSILDQLVAAFEVAERWTTANQSQRSKLLAALEIAEQRFVSLAQAEVGRARTASRATAKPGTGSPLDQILREIR